MIISCDWSVKDNDNESNSQLIVRYFCNDWVVIGLSKIMIMKAIHNTAKRIYSNLAPL